MFDNISGNFTIGIIQVPKHSDTGHTGCHASRLLAFLNKFDTETALFDITLFLNDPDIIRTGGNAIFATYAFIFVNQNHSIFSLMGGSGGTDLDAGRVIAMLALNRQKFPGIIGEGSVFPFLKMIIGLFFFKTILVMAGHSTSMTTYTLRFVDYHSISSHESRPLNSHLLF
jgi:hypothetical protein